MVKSNMSNAAGFGRPACHVAGATFIALALTSCASVFEGTDDTVSIQTPGVTSAECVLTNPGTEATYQVQAPGAVRVRKSKYDLDVACQTPDGATGTAFVESGTEGMTYLNFITGWSLLFGFFIDWGTGAIHDYDDFVNVYLRQGEASLEGPSAIRTGVMPSTLGNEGETESASGDAGTMAMAPSAPMAPIAPAPADPASSSMPADLPPLGPAPSVANTMAPAAPAPMASNQLTAQDRMVASPAPVFSPYGVQIASYRASADAAMGWENFQDAAPDLLGSASHEVRSVVLSKGRYHRLYVKQPSRAEANRLCDNLKRRNIQCLVARL